MANRQPGKKRTLDLETSRKLCEKVDLTSADDLELDTLVKVEKKTSKRRKIELTADVLPIVDPKGEKLTVDLEDKLRSDDIVHGIVAWEEKYPEFSFPWQNTVPAGTVPRLDDKIAKLIAKKNKTKFAFVFNTLPSGEGFHWTSLFIDMTKHENSYFDSFGDSPSGLIQKSISKIFKFFRKLSPQFVPKIKLHKRRRQRYGRECGVFCVWFVIQKVEGKTYRQIEDDPTDDDTCQNLRGIYWEQ